MAVTTLRKIVYKSLKEMLKKEDFVLKSELEKLTNHILDNSSLQMTKDSIYLEDGNNLGVGNENKDKVLKLPKLLLFRLEKRDIEDVVSARSLRWCLTEFNTLESLEMSLEGYARSELKPVVLMSSEIIRYEFDKTNKSNDGFIEIHGAKIKWEQEMYAASYESANITTEDKFRSRKDLEKHIIFLVEEGMESIKVESIMEKKELGFCITGTIYDTNHTEEENRVWFNWQEQEESEYWDGINDWDF